MKVLHIHFLIILISVLETWEAGEMGRRLKNSDLRRAVLMLFMAEARESS